MSGRRQGVVSGHERKYLITIAMKERMVPDWFTISLEGISGAVFAIVFALPLDMLQEVSGGSTDGAEGK